MTTRTVSSGITSAGVILGSGDFEYVNAGGRTVSTTVNSGSLLDARAGGAISATTVNAGGNATLEIAATGSGTAINTSGLETVFGTETAAVVSGARAVQRVSPGGSAFKTIVNSGGTQVLDVGSYASGTLVLNGGTLSDYGGIIDTTVRAGGTIYVADDGGGEVGKAQRTVVSSGGVQFVLGSAYYTVISAGGTENVNSGLASGTAVSSGGTQTVNGRGVTASTTVMSGGNQIVSSGGIASSSTLSGGTETIWQGGTAVGVTVSNGGNQIVSSGGIASGTTLSGGTETVDQGGTAIGVTVGSGGLLTLGHGTYFGGQASSVIVSAGGRTDVNLLGTLSGIVVQSGGVLGNFGTTSGVVLSGGTETIYADGGGGDGHAIGTIVSAGGLQNVRGYTSGTIVNSGGRQLIMSGTASGTTLNTGGLQIVTSDGFASNTIVNSGGRQVISTTYAGEDFERAYGTVVNSGGTQEVSSGGKALGSILHSGAVQSVLSSGTAIGTTLQFGATEIVSAGGRVSGTVVGAGASVVIAAGGTTTGLVLDLGSSLDLPFLAYSSGGTATVDAQSVLTITEGGQTYTQTLGAPPPGQLKLSRDASGGTVLLASGSLPAAVTIDPGQTSLGSKAPAIQNAMNQALAEWGAYILSNHTLQVLINFATSASSIEVATGTSPLQQVTGSTGLMTTQAQLEISGKQIYPGPDVVVTINPNYLNSIFFSTTPVASSSQVPANQIDGVSLFLHELAHAFGIIGQRPQTGPIAAGSQTPFDRLTTILPDGSANFTGATANGQYGDLVPLTTNSSGGENYYHVGNGGGPLAQDLMNGQGLSKGTVYQISGLDLAVLQDAGLPKDGAYYAGGKTSVQPIIPVTFATRAAGLTFTGDFVSWQSPGVTNATASTAFAIQRQIWLTTAPYTPNAQGVEILTQGYSETISPNSTSPGYSDSATVILPVSGTYYATLVLTEFDQRTGTFVQEDTISYGQVAITNGNPDAAKIIRTPKPPDEGDGGGDMGQGADSSGSAGSNDNSGSNGATGGGIEPGSQSGTSTPLVDTDPIGISIAPVYRFFDRLHGTQFLTSSDSESAGVKTGRPDLSYEGVGLQSATGGASDPNASPVFRFFDTIFGTHFYSSSATERDTIIATRPDLTFEGIGFYGYATPQPAAAPVFRFFESTNGTHFYTGNTAERAGLQATRPDMVDEGIAFYAPKS